MTSHNTNPTSRLGSLHYTDLGKTSSVILWWYVQPELGSFERPKTNFLYDYHCAGKSERDTVVRVPDFKVKSVLRLTLSFLIFYCCVT